MKVIILILGILALICGFISLYLLLKLKKVNDEFKMANENGESMASFKYTKSASLISFTIGVICIVVSLFIAG
jgi:hypothetical protein